MAKLKVRGRTELFRVEREKTYTDEERAARKAAGRVSDTIWEREIRTLMSDGTVLSKSSSKWPDEHEPGGVRKYDWDWKTYAKLKPGGDPKKLLDQYVALGFRVVSTGFALNSFDVAAYQAAETTRKARLVKQRAKREATHRQEHAPGGKHGPGFYVTNSTTSAFGKRAAEQGPFPSMEDAELAAWTKYRGFMQMAFHYLLPVQIVESASRSDAEHGRGHVWWEDGKRRGAPVDPRQIRFPGINGHS